MHLPKRPQQRGFVIVDAVLVAMRTHNRRGGAESVARHGREEMVLDLARQRTKEVIGDAQFTYDISVPENVTYIANGFVSHNTIGFMMDCDTTVCS